MGGAGSDWQINTELIVGSWWRRSDRSFVNGVCFVWFPYHLTHALTTRTLYVSRVWAGTEPVGWFLDRCGAGEAPEVAAAVPAGSISSPCKSRCIFASNPLFPYAAALLVKLTNLGSGLRRATCLSCLSPQRFLGRSLENIKTTKKKKHRETSTLGAGAASRASGWLRGEMPLGRPPPRRCARYPEGRESAWFGQVHPRRPPASGFTSRPRVEATSAEPRRGTQCRRELRNSKHEAFPITDHIVTPPPAPRAQVPEPAAFTATKREVELSVWL